MIAVNVSVDFELAWGDLGLATRDAGFRRRVEAGNANVPRMLEILEANEVPSTWGMVAACCVEDFAQLPQIAPRAFEAIRDDLEQFQRSCTHPREMLFRADLVEAIAASARVDVGSHGFLHLTPRNASSEVFAEDVKTSVRLLQDATRRPVESFIPPQNYFWPDETYAGTGIHFVRHTPRMFSYSYSDPARSAKVARLWNDLVRLVASRDRDGGKVWFAFLRTDRGASVWQRQFSMLRALIERGQGSLFCYTHPHNLDTAASLAHFAQFCEMVSNARQRNRATFRRFLRHVGAA